MQYLYDMHCHLDFLEDPHALAEAGTTAGISGLSCTVEPHHFTAAAHALAGTSFNCGLGLHPWYVASGDDLEAQLATFRAQLPETGFIGEIGLDLSVAHQVNSADQLKAFRAIATLLAEHPTHGGYTLSIHAVKSAFLVLDILEEAALFDHNAIIFHWFSGTSEELTRAERLGAYFSVGPRMLQSGRGRAYARALRPERLLLETDLPREEHAPLSVEEWRQALETTQQALIELKKSSAFPHPEEVLPSRIRDTSLKLLHRDLPR